MARWCEIPFGNSLTGLPLTPAQRARQLNHLARSLTVTGYASERAYGRRSAPALRTVTYTAIPTARSNQSHLKRSLLRASAIPPKAPPILLRGGTFGRMAHLKRRKTLQAFLVYSTPRITATAMQGDPSSPAFSQGRRGEESPIERISFEHF